MVCLYDFGLVHFWSCCITKDNLFTCMTAVVFYYLFYFALKWNEVMSSQFRGDSQQLCCQQQLSGQQCKMVEGRSTIFKGW